MPALIQDLQHAAEAAATFLSLNPSSVRVHISPLLDDTERRIQISWAKSGGEPESYTFAHYDEDWTIEDFKREVAFAMAGSDIPWAAHLGFLRGMYSFAPEGTFFAQFLEWVVVPMEEGVEHFDLDFDMLAGFIDAMTMRRLFVGDMTRRLDNALINLRKRLEGHLKK